MKHLLYIICVLVALFTPRVSAYAQQDLIDLAAAQYDSAHFQTTIDAYEQIAAKYGVNPDLYYNLGNAYYKQKQYAEAILNYERCLLMDPANVDAQNNLEMARLQCIDKIEAVPEVIFVTWNNGIRDLLSCDGWGWLAILFFLVFIICLFGYFFLRAVALRKAGFYGGILTLLLCVICYGYASAQQTRLEVRDYAIVMQPTVTVRSSPADSGTQLFSVHEGLKVRVRSTLSGWSEVELSDGKVGWLPSESIEII